MADTAKTRTSTWQRPARGHQRHGDVIWGFSQGKNHDAAGGDMRGAI